MCAGFHASSGCEDKRWKRAMYNFSHSFIGSFLFLLISPVAPSKRGVAWTTHHEYSLVSSPSHVSPSHFFSHAMLKKMESLGLGTGLPWTNSEAYKSGVWHCRVGIKKHYIANTCDSTPSSLHGIPTQYPQLIITKLKKFGHVHEPKHLEQIRKPKSGVCRTGIKKATQI